VNGCALAYLRAGSARDTALCVSGLAMARAEIDPKDPAGA
jgi:hypothetical protein